MKTSSELKRELDAAQAVANRLLNASLRSGKGPSPEYKSATAKAKCVWRLWCNALDVESGRAPCFPIDESGALVR